MTFIHEWFIWPEYLRIHDRYLHNLDMTLFLQRAFPSFYVRLKGVVMENFGPYGLPPVNHSRTQAGSQQLCYLGLIQSNKHLIQKTFYVNNLLTQ